MVCQNERQADPILSGLCMSGKIGKNMLRVVDLNQVGGRATYEDAMMVEFEGGGLGGLEVDIRRRCYRCVVDEGGTEVTLRSEQLNTDISRLGLVEFGS